MRKNIKQKPDWKVKFYNCKPWKILRQKMIDKARGICASCNEIIIGSPEVHHLIELTMHNVTNPNISFNPKLLKVLCTDCHNKQHGRFMAAEKIIIVNDNLDVDYGRRKYAKHS